MDKLVLCPMCQGAGWYQEGAGYYDDCSTCDGAGFFLEDEMIRSGLSENKRIREELRRAKLLRGMV